MEQKRTVPLHSPGQLKDIPYSARRSFNRWRISDSLKPIP
jgi:hypothetical protein